MLINLGLGSMIGTMTGITTPILDTFKIRKEILCGELTVSILALQVKFNVLDGIKVFLILFVLPSFSGLLCRSLPVRPAVCAAFWELLCHHV